LVEIHRNGFILWELIRFVTGPERRFGGTFAEPDGSEEEKEDGIEPRIGEAVEAEKAAAFG
jgi:hypothetical protein